MPKRSGQINARPRKDLGTLQIKSIACVLGWPFWGPIDSLPKVSLPCWKYICSRAIVHLSYNRESAKQNQCTLQNEKKKETCKSWWLQKNSTFQRLIGHDGSNNHNNKNKQQYYRLAKHRITWHVHQCSIIALSIVIVVCSTFMLTDG